jgi:hypothetical protein
MRDATSANTRRAKQARPLRCLEGTRFFGCAGGTGSDLIARGTTVGGGALTGEPIVPHRKLGQVFVGADNAPRVANLAYRGRAATVGDVAAGEGRGVARVAG